MGLYIKKYIFMHNRVSVGNPRIHFVKTFLPPTLVPLSIYEHLITSLSSYYASSTESSDESSLATSTLMHRLPQSMKIVHEIMYKVEVLYVLCVLLMGSHRNQVRG